MGAHVKKIRIRIVDRKIANYLSTEVDNDRVPASQWFQRYAARYMRSLDFIELMRTEDDIWEHQ